MAAARSKVKVSKTLSWILRHGAEEENLEISTDGWVKVSDILKKEKFKNESTESIKNIVSEDSKQRYSLKTMNNEIYIRANQGHSIQTLDLNLEEVKNTEDLQVVVHGTFKKSWPDIKSSGLSRMRRQHIHFATGIPGDDKVVSGIRKQCQIYIYVDAIKAIQDGFKFFKSENGVILCEGNSEGFLPTKYFRKNVLEWNQIIVFH